MAQPHITRKLTAILAADVAGYSRLMGEDEEGTLRRLGDCRAALFDPKVAEHHGRIFKTTGDGLLVEFSSVVDAVRCAVEIQRGMVERNAPLPDDKRMDFRMGINLGDVMAVEDDIYGDGVNVASRIEGLADPGGICLSKTVVDQVQDKLDLAFEDMGEKQVKNIARPVRVMRVLLDGAGRPPRQAAWTRRGSGFKLRRSWLILLLAFALGDRSAAMSSGNMPAAARRRHWVSAGRRWRFCPSRLSPAMRSRRPWRKASPRISCRSSPRSRDSMSWRIERSPATPTPAPTSSPSAATWASDISCGAACGRPVSRSGYRPSSSRWRPGTTSGASATISAAMS